MVIILCVAQFKEDGLTKWEQLLTFNAEKDKPSQRFVPFILTNFFIGIAGGVSRYG